MNDERRLDQWEPDEAWQPWRPSSKLPWNLKWAGHLLRRAAFGFPAKRAGEDAWEGLRRVVRQGLDATLVELFQPAGAEFSELLDTIGQQMALADDADNLRGWWLYRMLHTPQPLAERMTLFWHNHFATSVVKVERLPWMFRQNQTLRQHALGPFGPLVRAIARDPAMIVWLDLNRNVKGRANENFGRELMELFTLGTGNYTERDVQAAARAFTGWRTLDDRFQFEPRLHDDGPKTLLGQTGPLDGDDVIRILLAQPAAARFIVRKLLREFVSEAETPPDRLIEPLARQYRESDYDTGLLMRRILSSRLFFSETAYRQRIKSPAEFVVGTLRGLEAKVAMPELVTMMSGLGQDLFAPPNVAGWAGGKTWLNSATLLARDNSVWKLVGEITVMVANDKGKGTSVVGRYCDPGESVKKHAADVHGADDPAAQVGFLIDLFLQGHLAEPSRKWLVEYLKRDAPKDDIWQRRLRETLHTLLVLPDYQLA